MCGEINVLHTHNIIQATSLFCFVHFNIIFIICTHQKNIEKAFPQTCQGRKCTFYRKGWVILK